MATTPPIAIAVGVDMVIIGLPVHMLLLWIGAACLFLGVFVGGLWWRRRQGPVAEACPATEETSSGPSTSRDARPVSVARAADAVSAARAADGTTQGLAAAAQMPSVSGARAADASDEGEDSIGSRAGEQVPATEVPATAMPAFPERLPYLRANQIQQRRGRQVRFLQAAEPMCQHPALFNSAYNQWGWNVRCPDCPLQAHIRWASPLEATTVSKENLCDIALRTLQP